MSTTPDDAWDSAPLTTQADLDKFGGVDQWLRTVEGAASGGNNYSDDWSLFMFWINDIRYADRRHQGNQITTGDSQNTKNTRQTRTVVDSGPTFIRRDTLATKGVQDTKEYNNNTDDDAEWDYNTVEEEGVHSTVTVTKQASLTVGGSVSIGPFSINASGTISSTDESTLTNDTTKTITVTHNEKVPARKKKIATITTQTVTNTDIYEVHISIRGRNNQGSINVPFGNPGSTFDSIGTWYEVANLPGIGDATKQVSQFSLVTVSNNTDISYQEGPADAST